MAVTGFGDRPALCDAAKVAGLIEQLERGGDSASVAKVMELGPADVVAAVAFDALGDDDSEGLMLVQTAPRRPALERALSANALSSLWPRAEEPRLLGLSAGLLQIHDFWDASHNAAQRADDLGERSVSAYWHGIAHRREPDAGNASYWFRRVGRHPVFVELAAAAEPLIELADLSLVATLLPRGAWDPNAFISNT